MLLYLHYKYFYIFTYWEIIFFISIYLLACLLVSSNVCFFAADGISMCIYYLSWNYFNGFSRLTARIYIIKMFLL